MGQPTRLKRRGFILREMGILVKRYHGHVSECGMHSRFPHGPPWAIRAGLAGRSPGRLTILAASANMTLVIPRVADPPGILSVTVVPTVFLRSVPAFHPGLAERMPRPSGHLRETQKASLVEGSLHC